MHVKVFQGRAALSNAPGRFEAVSRVDFLDDFADAHGSPFPDAVPARITFEKSRSIISRNQSPDLPFEQSLNPYRGCEHGCIYCYARPTHSYLGFSPGLDFETELFVKENAAELLRQELKKPGYIPRLIALGANTDPYQPIERTYRITRRVLEVLEEFSHPVTIITKSGLVLRDLDLLSRMARRNLASVTISITSLDAELARKLEPRAAAPHKRLATLRALSAAGLPTGVLVAPVIPVLTDRYLESILEQARLAGARFAGYVLLRLPHEVKALFKEWLELNVPEKANHIMTILRDTRGGKEYVARWGERQRGTGKHADLLAGRFQLATRRLGLNQNRWEPDFSAFQVPGREEQMTLFT